MKQPRKRKFCADKRFKFRTNRNCLNIFESDINEYSPHPKIISKMYVQFCLDGVANPCVVDSVNLF